MHADVMSEEPGRCPKCGMKLMAGGGAVIRLPMHPDIRAHADRCPKCGMKLVPSQLVRETAHARTITHTAGLTSTTTISGIRRANMSISQPASSGKTTWWT